MACEKCWRDAYRRMMTNRAKSQAKCYQELLEERKDHPCGPEYESENVAKYGYPGEENENDAQ